jgi:hypothetical protein
MTHRLFSSLLVLLFLALSPGNALACGDSNDEKESCCTSQNDSKPAHCSSNSDVCSESHPGQTCPDEDGCGQCHCPGCGSIGGGFSGGCLLDLPQEIGSLIEHGDSRRQAFYFADHMPEDVYLPIWQPPQILV